MDRSKYLGEALRWEATGNPFVPYHTTVGGVPLEIQVSDDVDAPAFALVVGGVVADRFSGWPANWHRSDLPEDAGVAETSLDESDYARKDLTWERTWDATVPFRATVDGVQLRLELGDFPAENMYILMAGDAELARGDVLPANWRIPE